MADTTFVPGTTITASWLNDVNDHVYNGQDFAEIQFINVKDPQWGATGDGTTDDHAAIQAAIDSATGTLTGYCLYFPAGVYVTSDVLNIADKANMYLMGDGVNTTVIKPSASVTAAVKFGVSGTSNQGFSGIHISCADATSCIGLALTGIDGFWASDFKVSNASVGVDVVNGFGMFFDNFRVDDSIDAGVKINGGNDQFFTNGVLLNDSGSQPTYGGFWVVKNDAFWLDNIDCIYQKHGIRFSPTGTDYISWVFISNSAFDYGSGDGILFDPTTSATVKGVYFSNSWCGSNDNFGVNFTGAGTIDDVSFTAHRCVRNKKSGYYVDNAGSRDNVSFVNCLAAGNSYTNTSVYSGFDIAANVSGFKIIGCRSGAAAGQSNTQLRGIIVNSGTSDNYIIALNDLRTNTGAGLLDSGSGTSKHVVYNLNAVTMSKGSSTIATSSTTRTITHGLISTPNAADITITDNSNRTSSSITNVWVQNITSTTFDVVADASVSGTAFSFSWQARMSGA